jgi:hypothetical protein
MVVLNVTVLLGLELSGAFRAAGEGGDASSGSQLMAAALLSKVESGGMMEISFGLLLVLLDLDWIYGDNKREGGFYVVTVQYGSYKASAAPIILLCRFVSS